MFMYRGVTESSSNVLFSGHAIVSTCGETSLDEQTLILIQLSIMMI